MSIYLRVAAIVLFASICFSAGWAINGWRHDSLEYAEQRAAAERALIVRQAVAEIAKNTSSAIAGIRIENKTIYRDAIHEITRDVIYRDCVVPADGLQLINKARSAGN